MAIGAKNRKDFSDAVKRVRTALQEDSQNVDAYVVLAWTYYDMGKYELAKLVCFQAIGISPNLAAVHNLLGLVHMRGGDVTRALASFQKAIESDPKFVAAQINLGSITFGYKDYEASYRAFDAVIKLEPKNADALLGKAVAARGMGNFEEAEKGYKALLTQDERNAMAHFNLGVLYQEFLQKLDDAQKSFENVLRFEQANAELRKEATERIKQVQIQSQNQREAEAMMKAQAEQDRLAPPPPPPPPSAETPAAPGTPSAPSAAETPTEPVP